MFRPLPIFIGARYTRAKRRNHFISFISMTSMIGLSLGVLAMIVVLSVMNGFQREMSSRILGLVPHAAILGVQPLDDWHKVADAAMRDPAVMAAAPITEMEGMLSYKGAMQPIQSAVSTRPKRARSRSSASISSRAGCRTCSRVSSAWSSVS
jgi:ABC-type transport system, involved in lipoprotein release, permease component